MAEKEERIIISGFGGQGVMFMGQLLAHVGMDSGMEVSWLPSYGPEMRGGTANCSVILSDTPVGSPVITKPTTVIALNKPSVTKFEATIVPGGSLFINSSLVDIKATRTDINVYYVDCSNIAARIGNPKGTNMVMIGAFLSKVPVVNVDDVRTTMQNTLTGKKAAFIPANMKAIEAGIEAVG